MANPFADKHLPVVAGVAELHRGLERGPVPVAAVVLRRATVVEDRLVRAGPVPVAHQDDPVVVRVAELDRRPDRGALPVAAVVLRGATVVEDRLTSLGHRESPPVVAGILDRGP